VSNLSNFVHEYEGNNVGKVNRVKFVYFWKHFVQQINLEVRGDENVKDKDQLLIPQKLHIGCARNSSFTYHYCL